MSILSNDPLDFHINFINRGTDGTRYQQCITNLALFISRKSISPRSIYGREQSMIDEPDKARTPGEQVTRGRRNARHVTCRMFDKIGLRFLSRRRPLSASCRRCNDLYWPWDCRHMRWNSTGDKKQCIRSRTMHRVRTQRWCYGKGM